MAELDDYTKGIKQQMSAARRNSAHYRKLFDELKVAHAALNIKHQLLQTEFDKSQLLAQRNVADRVMAETE